VARNDALRIPAFGVATRDSWDKDELAPATKGRWIRRCFDFARDVYVRQRERRELLMLDDRSLADIGWTRSDALYEASKPFWKR